MRNLLDLTPGSRLDPVSFSVQAEEALAYLRAVDAAAEPGGAVPPVLLVARALRAAFEQVLLPPGTVHGGQECEFLGEAQPGAPLRAEVKVPRAATRQGQRFVVLEFTISLGDAAVCRGRASLIAPAVSEGSDAT